MKKQIFLSIFLAVFTPWPVFEGSRSLLEFSSWEISLTVIRPFQDALEGFAWGNLFNFALYGIILFSKVLIFYFLLRKSADNKSQKKRNIFLLSLVIFLYVFTISVTFKNLAFIRFVDFNSPQNEVFRNLDKLPISYMRTYPAIIPISENELACLVDCYTVALQRNKRLEFCVDDSRVIYYKFPDNTWSVKNEASYHVDGSKKIVFYKDSWIGVGAYVDNRNKELFTDLPNCDSTINQNCKKKDMDFNCGNEEKK